MSLYQTSNDDLSAMISAVVGTTVNSADYTVLGIRATTSADLPASGGKNTKIAIKMNSSSQYQGQINLYYDRLDLGALANFQPYPVSVPSGSKVSTILPQLLNQFGINWTMSDLADANVNFSSDQSSSTVVLTALSGSLGWTGSVTVTMGGLPNVTQAFFNTSLAGF